MASNHTTVSFARPEDVTSLVALRSAVARDMTARFGHGGWSTIPGKSLVLKQLRASRVLVARQDSRIVGTVRLATAMPGAFDSSAFTRVHRALYVLGLAVAPDARHRGLGRALVEAAKETARASSFDALWLDAYDHPAGAGAFYEKCGFRRAGNAE